MHRFKAPWSTSLKVITTLGTVALIGSSVVVAFAMMSTQEPSRPGHLEQLLALLPILILGGAAPFAVRGYTITPVAIEIRRTMHTTRLPRAELRAARIDPRATRGSIRLFGNGGLFSFTGLFRNAALGNYRAYLTDPHRAVVLWFSGRTVVVSPDDPQAFVDELGVPDHVA